jgi:hypothetical protein
MMAKRYYDSDYTDGMISEDSSSVANLPQGVVIKEYPKQGNYMGEGLDDGLSGVDKQISADKSKRKNKTSPEKY